MIVIVQGPPAAGKTTLATELARRLRVPRLSRDALTERLLDSLGVRDQAWTTQLSHAAHELMLHLFEELATANVSFVAEATLNPESAHERLSHLVASARQPLVEVFLHAPPTVLIDRYRERWLSGERHPGHHDGARVERLERHLRECRYRPIALGGLVIKVNAERSPAAILAEVMTALDKLHR